VEKIILNEQELDSIISRLTFQILESDLNLEKLKLIGIKRRGAFIADRIKEKILEFKSFDVETGYLDITLYRDDLTEISEYPVLLGTEIPFDIKDKTLILIDDVIYTGRTVRAALDALSDLGRPNKIKLVVLVDRGHRELPIQPDFTGKDVPTSLKEKVNVKMKELDGEDAVTIESI
jgi:pyrimidine operon attenuation protein/uracil phosphoribosyltransferase